MYQDVKMLVIKRDEEAIHEFNYSPTLPLQETQGLVLCCTCHTQTLCPAFQTHKLPKINKYEESKPYTLEYKQ